MLLNELVRQSATSPSLDLSAGMGGGGMTPGHQTAAAAGGGDMSFLVGGQGAPGVTALDTHVRQNSTDSGLGKSLSSFL